MQGQAAPQDPAAGQAFLAQQPAQSVPTATPFPPAQDNGSEGSADDLPF